MSIIFNKFNDHNSFSDSPTKEQTHKAVSHFLTFNQSFNCLENVSTLINSTPGARLHIPTTKYRIKKLINPHFSIKYYIKCIECKKYSSTSSNKVQCDWCGDVELKRMNSQYFVYLPFADQLKKVILKNFESILSYESHFAANSDIVTDVQDGIQFKNIRKKYPTSFVLSLTII